MKDNIRFIKNIIAVLIAIVIVACVINFTPGYRRDNYTMITNLVINNENVTEFLIYKIFIDEEDKLYIARSDLERIMEDEDRKGCRIHDTVSKGNIEYVPLESLSEDYTSNYIRESNVVIMDDTNLELGKATVNEDTNMKYKPRDFSKTVKEMRQGDEVTYFDTAIRGWRAVRTDLGEVGYIEDNKVTKE